jgi:acyl transferase domain-containing protein/acyl-CoA synthetase (AMP-forming)/AMP-acid ligase II/acyl carrier protein
MIRRAEPTTFADLLLQRGCDEPDRAAFTFVNGDEITLSYGDLDHRARAVATALRNAGARGERVLICLGSGPHYIAALLGCAYAGAVGVPAYLPDPARRRRTMPPLRAIACDAQPAIAIAPSADTAALRELLDVPLRVIGVEEALTASAEEPPSPTATDALALLVYTSGSTAAPKGVMVTHRNLLHNVTAFDGFDTAEPTAIVSWLPIFHDLGLLFGVLHPLFRGIRSVLLPATEFVERPLSWLEAIGRFGASASAAPNWAYDICVRKSSAEDRARLDLHGWTLALNGGEPVRCETLERFATAFAVSGFRREALYPSYGLAEGSGTVSGGPGQRGPTVVEFDRRALEAGQVVERSDKDSRVLVSCGQSLPGQQIRIVDPASRLPRQPGQVGEIWVAGPSVCVGYWSRADESKQAFRARLSTGEGPFLRTGDLGFLRNGELVITGRLKDVIIVHGSKYLAEDIELSLNDAHPALRAGGCAAFPVEAADGERAGVVCELRDPSVEDAQSVIDAVREAIAEHLELDVHMVALVERGSVPKTTSGKVRRRECRRVYLDRQLPTIAEWRAPLALADPSLEFAGAESQSQRDLASQAEAHLISYFARKLGVERDAVDRDAPFARFGLTSVEGVGLAAALGRHLGIRFAPTLLWEHPSIRAVADWHTRQAPVPRRYGLAISSEPIAIVGIACRFPGGASPAEFWRLLQQGEEAITPTPPERWRAGTFGAAGRLGGFLSNLDRFDAAFFGISPREAPHVDPRQRLMLELAWEALEDAGIPPDSLAGSDAGVFVAVLSNDYDQLLFRDLRRIDAYSGPGTANSIVANRISYTLDLHGPSLVVDTACSGSLVTIHLACQSIRSGESRLAVAGGVSVNLLPHGDLFFSAAGALSPDGRCRTFDAGANGIVRSEGAGLVVLKPLADAIADGDRVYAIIRGSAVNSDGRTNGLMAPNGRAQEDVIREAYRRAAVDPSDIEYVEVHGTGTEIGDPIELRALASVLAQDRRADRKCTVGSLKTNVGHLEPAAGVAGVIKVALALEHDEIPRSLHFEKPNPHIAFNKLPLTVAREPVPWLRGTTPRLAAVSSFGFGGTNAHVVLEEPPPRPVPNALADRPWVLPLSARSDAALTALTKTVRELLTLESAASVGDFCRTAAVCRNHHDRRVAAVGHTREELRAALAAFEVGQESSQLAAGAPAGAAVPLVFMFAGQGTQWPRMAGDLYEREPLFRRKVAECDRLFRRLGSEPILERLAADGPMEGTAVAQPAIFAVQIALAALWDSYGIRPDAVVGQSLGEVAAAYVAGALTLDDAVAVVHHRSRLTKLVEGQGKTAVVRMSMHEALLALTGVDERIAIAGTTAPRLTLLAGEEDTLRRLLDSLERRGVFCRLVPGVDVALHSPQMDPLLPDLARALALLTPRNSRVTMFSGITGRRIDSVELGPSYWTRNLREPFRVDAAVANLVTSGHGIFLEIGPHAVLDAAVKETAQAAGVAVTALSSMRRGVAGQETIAWALARLYACGRSIDWRIVYPHGRRVPFPSYPWDRKRYWFDQLDTGAPAEVRESSPVDDHPLLGRHVEIAQPPDGHVWTTAFTASSPPYLAHHRVLGAPAVPASVYLEMALAGAAKTLGPAWREVAGLRLERLLFLDSAERTVQLMLRPAGSGEFAFSAFSRGDGAWVEHAAGMIREAAVYECPSPEPLPAANAVSAAEAGRHYGRMRAAGFDYGISFQVLDRVGRDNGGAIARLRLPAAIAADAARYVIHPAILDGALQAVAAAFADAARDAYVPIGAERVRLFDPVPEELWCRARVRTAHREGVSADVTLFADDGRVVVSIKELRLRRIASGEGKAPDVHCGDTAALYEVVWRLADAAKPRPQLGAAAGRWLLVADAGGVAESLASLLSKLGGDCVLLREQSATELRRAILDGSRRNGEWRGVVDLRPLDPLPLEDAPPADYQAVVRHALDVIRVIVRALHDAGGNGFARVWISTRGAQAAGGALFSTAHAALWGLGRVLANEHPELWNGLIDLDPAAVSPDDDARLLLGELLIADGEDQVAFRGESRYIPRLRPLSADTSEGRLELDADGAYLVTGGFGGLGLELARFLADRGARALVLVGRSGANGNMAAAARATATVRALEAAGATVEAVALDVADETALAAFLEKRRADARPPIRGVVHAAGVTRDTLFLQSDDNDLDAVLRPKVAGAWALHRLLGREVDFFLLFSSISSLLGPIGQAAYAAANACLDALAQLRRSRGLAAMSIAWGPWAEVGMAARSGGGGGGIEPISVADGLGVFERLLRHGPALVTVVRADWGAVARTAGRRMPFLADVEGPTPAADAAGVAAALQDLLLAPAAERRVLLEAHLRDNAARVLRLVPSEVDTCRPLNALGMDSIMAVELRHRVEATYGLTFSIVALLEGSSIAALAERLASQLPAEHTVAELVAEIEDLSSDQVLELLSEESVGL